MCSVIPSRCTRRAPGPITNATYSRLSVTTQSTWKKSVASSVAAWARRKLRHDSSRVAGGGMRWARRIFRIVEAATRCPSRHSSPWIRTTPHPRFSRAIRKISSTRSSGAGGRWPPRRLRLAPLRRNESAVPAQQRSRGDDPMPAKRFRQDPPERCEHGPVGPRQGWLRVRPVQDRDLVPQHEYLRVLGGPGANEQGQPGQHVKSSWYTRRTATRREHARLGAAAQPARPIFRPAQAKHQAHARYHHYQAQLRGPGMHHDQVTNRDCSTGRLWQERAITAMDQASFRKVI